MFCKQFLAYSVHIDWCYHSIHKHSSKSQHAHIWWHRGCIVVPLRVDILFDVASWNLNFQTASWWRQRYTANMFQHGSILWSFVSMFRIFCFCLKSYLHVEWNLLSYSIAKSRFSDTTKSRYNFKKILSDINFMRSLLRHSFKEGIFLYSRKVLIASSSVVARNVFKDGMVALVSNTLSI